MTRILTILFLFLLIDLPQQSCAQKVHASLKNISSSYKKQIIDYKLISAQNHTYGYNIFINDTLFIHQPVIPCVAGSNGFKSKADAKNIAVLVIEKIRKGIIPPTVTIPEMQKLGIDLR